MSVSNQPSPQPMTQQSRIAIGSLCILYDRTTPVNDGMCVVVDELRNDGENWWASIVHYNESHKFEFSDLNWDYIPVTVTADRVDVLVKCLMCIGEVEMEEEKLDGNIAGDVESHAAEKAIEIETKGEKL
jgi:hypothetical protein